MGLAITACSHLELAKEISDQSEILDEEWLDDQEWVGHAGFDRLDGRPQGFYKRTEATESTSFGPGSYGTYNGWRANLAQSILGIDPQEIWMACESFVDKPFVELICFSDCEGAIGSDTSAKLAKDFSDHAEKARQWAEEYFAGWKDEIDWWVYVYESFQRAFEVAAQGGFVMFH